MPVWLTPWLIAAIAIYPLRLVERWIHRHIQGLGLLLTNNPQAAVLAYYIILLPGVFLHELSQWVLAKILQVPIKKFSLWPEEQKGLIRLGLVEIDQKKTDVVRSTLVGIIPLVSGIAVIAIIQNAFFDTETLLAALSTGDLPTIWQGIRVFTSAPDFWLWFYVVFAVGNAMLPEEHDQINWYLPAGVLVGAAVVLWILDLSILLGAALEGPLAQFAGWLSIGLVTILLVDIFMMIVLSILEAIFSQVLSRELDYT